jgi:hypothetical protein
MPTKTNSPIKKMSKSQMWDAGIGVASVGLGLLGVPPSITSMAGQAIKGQAYDPANEEGYVDPTVKKNVMNQYSENIEEILPNKDLVNKYGIPMTGKPLKMLTGVNSPMTYKMSAAQYKSALKMSEISGAAPLQSNAFYASLNAAKEKGADTFNVGGKTFNVK